MTAAHEVIVLDFADERSVVQTRFATTQLALLRAHLGEDLTGPIADAELALSDDLGDLLTDAEQYTFLGRGWTTGLAAEAALKMREAARAWTESYPAMEYRHGPISIAGPGRVTWMLGPPSRRPGGRGPRLRRHLRELRPRPDGRTREDPAGGRRPRPGARPQPRRAPPPHEIGDPSLSKTLVNARVVTGHAVTDGWLSIEEGRITHIGHGTAPRDGESLGHRLVVPGFVDMHVHGGGGAGYPAGSEEQARRAFAFHLSRGTTTAVASLVTAPLEALRSAAGMLAGLCAEGLLAGVHFEGPYISAARCGAHRPGLLRTPSVSEFTEPDRGGQGPRPHVHRGPGTARRPGGHRRLRRVRRDRRHRPHRRHLRRGPRRHRRRATVATHLFNAMRPLGHRDPGPITAALADERVTVELINDGFHLHPEIINLALRAAKGGVAFVTDAMDAAGMPDGDYDLGPMKVEVRNGEARLEGGGSIAGSTLTMDQAFRRGVPVNGLSLSEATEVTSLNPARALGLDQEVGTIAGRQTGRPGRPGRRPGGPQA